MIIAAASPMDKFDFTGLLGMPPERFLRRYWQRKPLFVKQAFDASMLDLAPQALFALAARDDVESRLVQRRGDRWRMEHGPFATMPRAARDWTLLVQGVNLHDARADAVLDRFRWLPHARIDDVMMSVAVDGGGVGPHFDSYDVFLLQGIGTRRWHISMQRDLALVDGMPLKILARFQPEAEFMCEPGDLLYLPPRCAHDGVAIGLCTTWSVGFRAPTHTELLCGYLESTADDIDLPGRYADPGMAMPKRPAEVPERMVDTLETLLRRLRFDRADMALWLGEHLSEPKSGVAFDRPARVPARSRWFALADRVGVRLDARSSMLHDRRRIFINGESFDATGADGRVLRQLADCRALTGHAISRAPDAVRDALFGWFRDGWLHPGNTFGDTR